MYKSGHPCEKCGRRTCTKCRNFNMGGHCRECCEKAKVPRAITPAKSGALDALKDRAKAEFAKKRPAPPKPVNDTGFKSCENCHHRLADGGNCAGCGKEICKQCARAVGGCQECKDAGALN